MQQEVRKEDWLWLLGSLTQLHGIAFDADLLQRDFPPPFDTSALLRAGQALGLALAAHTVGTGQLADLTTPCVAWLQNDETELATLDADIDQASPIRKPALILRADADRLLYFEAGSDMPHAVPAHQFATLFAPDVLLVKRAAEPAKDHDIQP